MHPTTGGALQRQPLRRVQLQPRALADEQFPPVQQAASLRQRLGRIEFVARDAGSLREADVQLLVARRAGLAALRFLGEVLEPHPLQLRVLRGAGEHRRDRLWERLGEEQVELLDEAVELGARQLPLLDHLEQRVLAAVLPLLQLLHLGEKLPGIERHRYASVCDGGCGREYTRVTARPVPCAP